MSNKLYEYLQEQLEEVNKYIELHNIKPSNHEYFFKAYLDAITAIEYGYNEAMLKSDFNELKKFKTQEEKLQQHNTNIATLIASQSNPENLLDNLAQGFDDNKFITSTTDIRLKDKDWKFTPMDVSQEDDRYTSIHQLLLAEPNFVNSSSIMQDKMVREYIVQQNQELFIKADEIRQQILDEQNQQHQQAKAKEKSHSY